MRLFIGVELDDRTRAAAADVAERLRGRLQRVAPDLRAAWVPPANLHVTLLFIGEVSDASSDGLAAALAARPFATPAFNLGLGGCGAFPPSGPPRALWIGAASGADRMVELHRELEVRLRPLGYQPERRAYTPHLTIGRVKEAGRGASRPVREALAALAADCGACRIGAVALFRSRLSPRGATYEPLLRVPLS